ncbi:MAG: flagellar biosynthesis protein FlhF [Spirochaetes bacterium]|nr:flagellar biosynthesis protein FlhF [Spirochaetota bacterium]
MRYVKVKAKTYNDAMMKLRMEYGDDAIPISHKYVKEGGFLNSKIFGKEMVELTAAIQEKKVSLRNQEKKQHVDFRVGETPDERKILASNILSSLNSTTVTAADLPKADAIISTMAKKNVESSGVVENELRQISETNDTTLVSLKRLEKEFSELKEVLNGLLKERQSTARHNDSDDEESYLEPCKEILKNNDYDIEESKLILQEVKNSMSKEDLKDRYKIEKTLKELLKSKIVTTGPYHFGHKKKVIMFFGPTGVGKTTTMAKLGAIYALREDRSVAFITLDNYRIAATEQLKKYAEIMKIPVYAVNDQKEFKSVLDKEKAEIIMIDTSGRSHRNELKISEIKSYADLVDYDFEKILCVSANTKKSDMQEIFKSFDKIHFDSVIITKVDETSAIGNVIDIAEKFKKPISYFTNGQEVPNDIVLADPENLVNLMFGITGK